MKKLLLLVIVWVMISLYPSIGYAESLSTPSGIPTANIEETVDSIMEAYIEEDVPGASVSIVQDEEIVFQKGYGLANRENGQPIHPEKTYMEAGSVSKLFTWTAIMQLVEEGQISLDTDVRPYLKGGESALTYDEPITVAHLMTHTAGFEERVENLTVYDPDHLFELEDYLAPDRQPKQLYPPGDVVAYSNFSTNLAGYMVEELTGMAFADYVEQLILTPLEMGQSTFDIRYDRIPGLMDEKAIGYTKKGTEWVAKPTAYINDNPAGGLTTTTNDLAHFMLAHLNTEQSGSYVLFNDPQTLETMHQTLYTPHPDMAGNAHGFWERQAGDHRVLEHGGNTDAFSALLSIVPDEQFGIAVMTNMDGEMAGARRELTDVLIGKSTDKPEAAGDINHSEEVEGRYRSARSVETGPMKIMPFLSDADSVISANQEGGITLSIAALGLELDYVETAPYLFEKVTEESSLLDNAGMNTNHLYFKTNDAGEVEQLSYGVIADELPISWLASPYVAYGIAGGAALFSLVGLVWGIVGFIRKRRHQTHMTSVHRGVIAWSFIGVLTLGLFGAIVVQLANNPFQPWSNFTFYVIGFWLLLIAFLALLYPIVKGWRKQKGLYLIKVFVVLLGCLLTGLYSLLFFLNFLYL
ncbi:CubicO group peptidase (beta-lactamase class C family) [Alkalihalobacillus xiaoxiensis]|uniref:CubicO group peptidase (Beta-lactamase class C family) n=1 Tax=Shouchella xiaoxiensis TaxID=766895 RepID=A0ABS2SYP8_9BACI|nr:serine hydrolase [Shouchella xiaoxiensis]MBM7840649.1 CubicO group peptidase (beta-lactamase class C family) [Shouchella xiaoxiensis]